MTQHELIMHYETFFKHCWIKAFQSLVMLNVIGMNTWKALISPQRCVLTLSFGYEEKLMNADDIVICERRKIVTHMHNAHNDYSLRVIRRKKCLCLENKTPLK